MKPSTGRSSTPLLRPARAEEPTARLERQEPSQSLERSTERETTPIQPATEPKRSTVSWLMGIPALLFSPSKPSRPTSSRPSTPDASVRPPSPSPPPSQPDAPESPPDEWSLIQKACQELRLKRRFLEQKKAAGTITAKRIDFLTRKFNAEEREIEARKFKEYRRELREEKAARAEALARGEEFSPEQVPGSNKRKLGVNTFALVYSSDEDESDDEADAPAAAPETTIPIMSVVKTPLKSALKSGQAGTSNKRLRINETPTRIKKLWGHYGPAGEYRGSTFAYPSCNSFSSAEDQEQDCPQTRSTDDSSVPSDARSVRNKVLSPDTKMRTFMNSMPASEVDKSLQEIPNPFHRQKKGEPWVQPNSFRVPYLDEPSDEEDEVDGADTDKGEQGGNNQETADAGLDTAPAPAPATPKLSHAELPDVQTSVQVSGPAQDEHARSKDSEEAALKKLREAAQKYKPKTSSRLSTVEEKTRSQSSSPPPSDAQDSSTDSNNKESIAEQQQPSEGPHPQPYTWTQPPKRSYSTQAPDYQPWSFDDTHIGTDGLTDKQRRAAKDAAADDWVAENIKWPEATTYVDAGLCSNYIDNLVKTEVCEEGKERTEKIMGQQLEEILKWAHEENAKGNQCALTWNNGREELVWAAEHYDYGAYIVSAIEIAWDPSVTQSLKRQAFDYVNQLRQEPSAWQPCLSIFTHEPRHAEVVRVYSLEIVNNAVQAGLVDQDGLGLVKDQLLQYLQRSYTTTGTPPLPPDTSSIENKMAQTVTYLFSTFYASGWETCFDDLLALTSSGQGTRDNAPGVVFYLRVINSVHDEIGDVLMARSRDEQDKANALKDLVRERDVGKIAASWQEILAQWTKDNDLIAELCLKAIGRWVSWVDISLVVNQPMLELLFQQLQRAQQIELPESAERARDAAIDVFTEIIAKKMPAADKIQLLSFLNLDSVVDQLIKCPPLNESRGSSKYNVDLAETVAKLVNGTVVDIIKILDSEKTESETWAKAERVLASFLPHLLRFFSDEYDEVCSAVLNAMNDVLAFLRKTSQGQLVSPQRAVMLLPILKAIFTKMRYDETASWGDDDDKTDEAEFQELRKRLASLQQSIAAADEQLYLDAVSGLVRDTFSKLRLQPTQLDWRDLDLALHQIFLLGDLAVRAGGLYQKNKPNSATAEKLVELMQEMVQSNTGSFIHPAIQLQYMEICVRYTAFFQHHTSYIDSVLQTFLQCAHHSSLKVRARSWYLLQRLIRDLRVHVGHAAEAVVQSLQDVLLIRAEIPSDDDGDMSSDGDSNHDSTFSSQLYLFEAVGCISGATSIPVEKGVQLIRLVMQPLFADIQQNLEAAKASSELAILQVHHDIMALGTMARGYSDFSPGTTSTSTDAAAGGLIMQAFSQVSQITLLALDSLKSSFQIRTAARFAFSRLIGMAGAQMLPQLPQWVDGLLTESSSRDEMALFLRLLDQVIYGFRNEIYDFLDRMFTGLLQRVFSGISAAVSGTDDEIELAELKREYLNFLLVILGNDLGPVLVSTRNQPIFETIISTLEHFAKDIDDYPTAKMAFVVMTRMCTTWGGPDTVQVAGTKPADSPKDIQAALPGFDQFMITRFSPLCWAMPSNPTFNSKDAQARQVLTEAAALQKTIYLKLGDRYLDWMRDNELRSMGMSDAMVNEFLAKLSGMEMKGHDFAIIIYCVSENGSQHDMAMVWILKIQNRSQNFQPHQRSNQAPSSGSDLMQLAVKGWAAPPSKFSGNPESGVSAIVTFLEKKSQRKIHSHRLVGKSHILFIDIDAADSQRFFHLHGFTFSGAPLTIEESRGRPGQGQYQPQQNSDRTPLGPGQQNQLSNVPTGPRGRTNERPRRHSRGSESGKDLMRGSNNQQNGHFAHQQPSSSTSEKEQLQDLMVRIIRKRYDAESRFLTFEQLSTDPDIASTPLVQSTAGKVWSAFFTVCANQVFGTAAQRRAMVESISLANNNLVDVKDVIALSATFPQLKNLDLSNNNISTAGDLRFWRNSLRSIEHLILANNPIMNNPAELQKLVRWWARSLKLLNHQPVNNLNTAATGSTTGSGHPNMMAVDSNGNPAIAPPSPPQSPVPPFAGITSHPEVDVREFGQPQPGKSEEQVIKERMGLQFSVETHLKMYYVELCLAANNFDYDKAMANIREMWERGEVPAEAFLGQ
ncbi:hypothetical protein DV738_g61, partial [Chaetothyriales sp. CBS 135597]